MPNDMNITALTEILHAARDRVAREMVGAVNSVTINSGSEGVSLGGTVKSFVTAQPTLNTSHTPAPTPPATDDTTIGSEDMTIGQVSRTNIPLKGEVVKQLQNIGQYGGILEDLFAQHLRTHVNAIEAHTCSVIYRGASRAVGTAGTTPFASSHALIPQAHQILKDNGFSANDGQKTLVINTSAGTNLKNLAHIYKVNEAGSSETIRRGVLMDIDGVMIKESAGIATHTAGAGSGYDIVAGGEAIGQTTLSLEGGTVNTSGFRAGDIISIDTDAANRYVVRTGLTATSGDLVINAPGLRVAGVNASELTIGGSYTANFLVHRSAVELVMRPPAMPEGGDMAIDRMTLADEVSGLVFEIALYKGYAMNWYEIVCYYQAKVWKSDAIALLIG